MDMDSRLIALEGKAMFEEWQAWHADSDRSLSRAANLMAQLGLARRMKRMSVLGVVGSKGKGTASIYASAALAAGGNEVATMTSPGVVRHRDRVRINGRVLDAKQYEKMLRQVIDARAGLEAPDAESGYLSPSGLFTLGGLAAAAEQGCRVAVVEAGIGGLADELSLLPLDVVVVTEIFDEHAAEIGPTVVDIATNKIGVVTKRTKTVVSLPQSDGVRQVIERRCATTSTELIWIDDRSIRTAGLDYPLGLSRLNAVAGVRAGVVLSELLQGAEPPVEDLRRVVNGVTYPGRLSVHPTSGGEVVVDSAISRAGLVAALDFARQRFGPESFTVFLSVPVTKDFDGCVEELTGLDGLRRVFVDMPGSHLTFPKQDQWPWEWMDVTGIQSQLAGQNSLVVGTATYTGQVLEQLGVDTDIVF